MPTERDMSISPDHDNLKVGSCNACKLLVDKDGNMEQQEVWLLRFSISSFRLCNDCMHELVERYYHHKNPQKPKRKKR